MTWATFVVCLVLFATLHLGFSEVHGDQITITKDIAFQTYNDIWKNLDKVDIRFALEENDGSILIYWTTWINNCALEIRAIQERPRFRELVGKYLQWNTMAVEKGVEIQKEIGTFRFRGWWKFKDDKDWKNCEDKGTFLFFSQSPTRHQLVLKFPKLLAYQSDVQFEDFYIDYDQAKLIQDVLSDEYISQTFSKSKNQKAIESEFR